MSRHRITVAQVVVCSIGLTVCSAASAQSKLGAAADAAAKQRQATAREQAPATPTADAAPPADVDKPAADKPAADKAPTPQRKYTNSDLPGNRPEDLARKAKFKDLDARYDDLLARMQDLQAKMKEDVRFAKSAEFELKIFKLDMANRNKYEKRQELERKLEAAKAIVRDNLVVLEKLRAEQRVLDAELERLKHGG